MRPPGAASRPLSDVTIYHNPACGTSRNTLRELIAAMAISVRDLLRGKEPRYAELGLDDPALSDDQRLDAMLADPILINRPIVAGE